MVSNTYINGYRDRLLNKTIQHFEDKESEEYLDYMDGYLDCDHDLLYTNKIIKNNKRKKFNNE